MDMEMMFLQKIEVRRRGINIGHIDNLAMPCSFLTEEESE